MNELDDSYSSWSVSELRNILNGILKGFSGDRFEVSSKQLPNDNSRGFVKVNISNWNDEEKSLLFHGALTGVYYYYFKFSNKKSFSLHAYNSTTQAMDGNVIIYLYLNGIKWYSPTIKAKLHGIGINFPEMQDIRQNDSSSHTDGLSDYGGWEQDEMMNENN